MTIIEQIKSEIERLKNKNYRDADNGCNEDECFGYDLALKDIGKCLDTVEESGDGLEIVKEVRITPGMLSNFGSSYFVIDVELTQEEQSKLHLAPGFGSCGVKIKIVCE